jgi:hypothetical protein
MNLSALQHIPLASAFLCGCGQIGNSEVACPACAATMGLLPLASVLNRNERSEGMPQRQDDRRGLVGAKRAEGHMDWL